MGITSEDDATTLSNYSLNIGTAAKMSTDPFYFELGHEYIDRCYLLDTLKILLVVYSMIFTIISIPWCVYTFDKWKQ